MVNGLTTKIFFQLGRVLPAISAFKKKQKSFQLYTISIDNKKLIRHGKKNYPKRSLKNISMQFITNETVF